MKTCYKCKIEEVGSHPSYCKRCFSKIVRNHQIKNNISGYRPYKKKFNKYMKDYYKNPINKAKKGIRAKSILAAKNGTIVRASFCQYPLCISDKLEIHHEDYRKPLDVKWLCKKHHGLANRVQKLMPPEYQLT